MRFHHLLFFTVTTLGLLCCSRHQEAAAPAQSKTPVVTPPSYTLGTPSAGGIGKFYCGREIAQVMGHPAIGWLERDARETEEAPTKAINALDLKDDAVIADIGAGSGYYTFRISPKVPIKLLHKMTEVQARLELEGAGFRFVSNNNDLPWQHFLVFERP